jgi:hypothetical protein
VPCHTSLCHVQSVCRFRSGAPSPYVSRCILCVIPVLHLVSPPAHPSTCSLYIRSVDEITFIYEFKKDVKSENPDFKRLEITRGGCFPALTTLLFCVLLCVSYEFQSCPLTPCTHWKYAVHGDGASWQPIGKVSLIFHSPSSPVAERPELCFKLHTIPS